MAVGVTGVVLAAASLEARPRRSGEVVRVERPRRTARDRVRMCTFLDANGKLTCLGNPPPTSGAMIDLFELQGPHRGRTSSPPGW